MSNVRDRARAGWKRHSQSVFNLDLTFESPKGQQAVIKGIGTRHSIQIDTDGLPVRGPNNHVSFHEDLIPENNPDYKIRFGDKIKIEGHRVSFVDSAGNSHTHIIKEAWPDQTTGMVVCMLENEEESFEDRAEDC